jgi:hypothetical protein
MLAKKKLEKEEEERKFSSAVPMVEPLSKSENLSNVL